MPKKQGCGAVTFLVGSGSGSGEAFRLRLRLQAKCTGSGDSGSGSGSDGSSPHMSLNQEYDFEKCQMSKYDFLLTWT